jgi:Zn-dependent peptidase ImmA (M78 family)/DNA-binding XRE family transcriptional regulator
VTTLDYDRVGQLLRDVREQVGLTQKSASEAVGVNRVLLSYYETGERPVPLTVLSALARVYGRTPSQLLEGVEVQPEPVEILYRSASEELSDTARSGMAQFSALVRSYAELASEGGGQTAGRGSSPLMTARSNAGRKEAARLARETRELLGLGDGPIGDHLFAIADEWALVFRLPLGEIQDHSPSGFFYNDPLAGFCIAVNSEMTLGRQLFTLAHEMAHAFFHSQSADVWISFPGAPQARERFADLFAGELLVPEDALIGLAEEIGGSDQLADPVTAVQLQRHFGVSYATLLVRLRQEKLVSEPTYHELREVSPSKMALALGYDVNPADLGDYHMHPLDRIPGRMLRLTKTAIAKGLITRGDAAETLGLSSEDVLQLLDRPRADAFETRAVEELEGGARF